MCRRELDWENHTKTITDLEISPFAPTSCDSVSIAVSIAVSMVAEQVKPPFIFSLIITDDAHLDTFILYNSKYIF